jgi:putative ABC transport system permease protein
MSIWTIALRSIQQRWLPSLLTAFSMALGVTLMVAVVTIHGVVTAQFRNNATLGYNMIVGPEGGKLQLTLNSVYYLSQPIDNVDYRFYLEFYPVEVRDPQIRNSYAVQTQEAAWRAAALSAASPAGGLWNQLGLELLRGASQESLDLGRDGKFADYTAFAIPLCMGDYYGRFRVVGTTPDMFDVLPKFGRAFEFAQGRNFQRWTRENGYFEAVVGSEVAREMNVQVGDEVYPAHGDPDGHAHEDGFRVVGVLGPSGSPNDRAVFVNMEGFLLMAQHAKPLADPDKEEAEIVKEVTAGGDPAQPPAPADGAPADGAPADGAPADGADDAGASGEQSPSAAQEEEDRLAFRPLPLENREVTSILLRTSSPLIAPSLQYVINDTDGYQVVQPIKEIYDLLDLFVTPVQQLLLVLTLLIIVVSGVSILVSIYNSMSERRGEIAVMRALGASRGTVMMIILSESIILSLGGGLCGLILGHALNGLASPLVEARTGVAIGFFDFAPAVNIFEFFGLPPWYEVVLWPELLLIPILMVLAILVGLLPALAAYRTDVADSLGK